MNTASSLQVANHGGDEEVGVLLPEEKGTAVVSGVVAQLPSSNDQSAAKETTKPLLPNDYDDTVAGNVQEQQHPVACDETANSVAAVKEGKSQTQASTLKKRTDRDDKFAVSRSGRMLSISASDAYSNIEEQQQPVVCGEPADGVATSVKNRKPYKMQASALKKRNDRDDKFAASRSGRMEAASDAQFAVARRPQLSIAVTDAARNDKFASVRRGRSQELSVATSGTSESTKQTHPKKLVDGHDLEYTPSMTPTGQMLEVKDELQSEVLPGAVLMYPAEHVATHGTALASNTFQSTSNIEKEKAEHQDIFTVSAVPVVDAPLVLAVIHDDNVATDAVTTKPRCSRLTKILIILLLLIVVGVSVTLGVLSAKDEIPALVPTMAPSMSFAPTSFSGRIVTLLQSKSASTSFNDPNSAQSQALEWLLTDKYTSSTELSDERVIQRFVLVTLWYATNGANWTHGGWLEPSDECLWNDEADIGDQDVRCDNGTVWSLALNNGDGLTGTIPIEIGLLSDLKGFFIHGNSLEGSLPTEIGELTKLTRMDLQKNKFTGQLPSEMAKLSNMHSMYLFDNQFTGTIPSEWSNMFAIEQFHVFQNLLEGTLPVALAGLPNARRLLLSQNNLTGTIPTEYGALTKLSVLEMHRNALNGTIPSELGRLTKLEKFALFLNDLTGVVPADLGDLTGLTALNLKGNDFSGTVPSSICATVSPLLECGATVVCDCCKPSLDSSISC